MEVIKHRLHADEVRIDEVEKTLDKHDARLAALADKTARHDVRISHAEDAIKSNNALIWKVIAALMTCGAGTVSALHFTPKFFQ